MRLHLQQGHLSYVCWWYNHGGKRYKGHLWSPQETTKLWHGNDWRRWHGRVPRSSHWTNSGTWQAHAEGTNPEYHWGTKVQDLQPVFAPADQVLGKDLNRDLPNCSFNYASVIGMMWYLYGHSRLNSGFAVSQAARFAFSPKRSHELALIHIGQYLKATNCEGLIMKPIKTDTFKMDVCIDSNFLGMHGKERQSNPNNVQSRTGCVILLNDCPVAWASKLLDPIAMLSMMAEYYSLSTAMREVLPLRWLVWTIAKGCKLLPSCLTTFKTTVWEDNMGALTLANLDPEQNTPRSKFYDLKVRWFRSHLKPNQIKVLKIDTKEQITNIYTKPLSRPLFEVLRKLLMGW